MSDASLSRLCSTRSSPATGPAFASELSSRAVCPSSSSTSSRRICAAASSSMVSRTSHADDVANRWLWDSLVSRRPVVPRRDQYRACCIVGQLGRADVLDADGSERLRADGARQGGPPAGRARARLRAMLDFIRVAKPSGNSVVRAAIFDEKDVQRTRDELRTLGCASELMGKNLISVDIPASIDYSKIQAWFERHENDGVLEYEEACLGDLPLEKHTTKAPDY